MIQTTDQPHGPTPTTEPAGDGPRKARKRIEVLLVDDHQMFRDGLAALLEPEPDLVLVGQAADGRTALSLARKLRPDVAIMDIVMPDLNGIDATRQILDAAPGISVLGLSMRADRRFIVQMLRAGALGYLFKGSAFDELTRAIRVVSTGHWYVSPGVAEEVVKDYLNRVPAGKKPSSLTPREREVLQLLAEGHSTRNAGVALHISVKTIETHRSQIMAKLGVRSIAGLTKYAIQEGLTSLDN